MLPSQLKATFPYRTTFKPRAFSTAWVLQAASLIDTHCPSLLNHILTASDCKRQVIFAALADLRLTTSEKLAVDLRQIAPADCLTTLNPLAQIGRALMVSKPQSIVEAVFGSVPDGLMGVLQRLGHQPFANPRLYRVLHDLFATPLHRQKANVLREIGGPLNETTIQIIRELAAPWLRPEIVIRLRSLEEMRLFQDAVTVVTYVRPDLSEDDLARSFESLGARTDLQTWVSRFIESATCFPPGPPIADDAEFRCLRTGREMQDAARHFRNCLASRIPEVALGRVAFVLYAPGPALIELARLTDGRNDQWALDSVHGAGHADVSPDAVRSIRSKLTGAGILIPSRFNEPRHVRSVGHLLGMFDLDCWVLGDREAEAPLASIEHEQFA